MTTVLDILNEIAGTASKLEKLAIMKTHAGSGLFRTVCQMAYEPSLNFYISAPEQYETLPEVESVPYDLEAALNDLLLFSKGEVRGNQQRDDLRRILGLLYADDAEVVCRILSRDLKSGFNVSSVNKTWPGLVSTFDFMLADTDTSAIVYPAMSQLKADGIRAKLHISPDIKRVTAISRQGKPIEIFDLFDEEGLGLVLNQVADLDGEFVCFDENNQPLPRKISNGILNKAIKGTITREEAESIRFVIFDIDDPDGQHTQLERFLAIEKQILHQNPKRIMLIESRIVNNYEEALLHFKEIRRRGLEGTIVKNLDGIWVPKRTKNLCKFKAEYEGDFLVTGFEYGTGKNKNRVGAIFVESQDGLVKTKCGIFKDFDESVRDELLTSMPPMVTILYNERITDKSRKDGTESLFLPRVVQLRYDKSVANTREELIKIEEAALKD